jgi:TusA-related sulfurtransferase
MTEKNYEPDVVVDSRDSTCPGPLMDLIGKVQGAESGKVLELKTTDKGSKDDVPDWLDKAGHELLEIVDRGDYWSLYVRKS